MMRQLTPESALKNTMRSGFLPKIPMKSSAKQEPSPLVFSSLDVDRLQRKTKNFDFSNLGRTIQTSYQRSRTRPRGQLQPLHSALNQRIQTRQHLSRLMTGITKAMQQDSELQLAAKHLFLSEHRLVQLFLMLAQAGIDADGFQSVRRKLGDASAQIVELDRMFYCIQFLSLSVPQIQLMQLCQLSEALSNDPDFGMVVHFVQLFGVLKEAIKAMRNVQSQQELSTTTASEEEERLSPTAKVIQRVLSKQGARKVQFKTMRVGYLNEQHAVAYYDSLSDLMKHISKQRNAKNYIFGSIRIGFIDLTRFPQYHDDLTSKEMKIFGKSRSKLPVFVQVVYRHKTLNPSLEIALTKLHLYQAGFKYSHDKMNLRYEQRDFIDLAIYLSSYGLTNHFQTRTAESLPLLNSSQIIEDWDIIYKPLLKQSQDPIVPYFDFDDSKEKATIKQRPYKPTEILTAESSDSEPEEDVYQPLFVKSIQSYPQYLTQPQLQIAFVQLYRHQYSRMATTCKISKDDIQTVIDNLKPKPEHQSKESFVVVPALDSYSHLRHLHPSPEPLDVTDEEDNTIYETPIEALEKSDLSLSFQFQPLIRDEPPEMSMHLVSKSSLIIQDEQKVNDKLVFAHSLAPPFICLQDCHSFMLRLRFPFVIPFQPVLFEVTKEMPIKVVSFDPCTVIIDETLTFEQSIIEVDMAPLIPADSDEEPSFDEGPLEIEIPELPQETSFVEKVDDDDEYTIEKVTQTEDFDPKEFIEIEVKGEYVSKLNVDGRMVHFFLDERLRKTEPMKHRIQMEGKEIQSVQLVVDEHSQRNQIKVLAFKAMCDQRMDNRLSQNERKPNNEEEETVALDIYEGAHLPEGWNVGHFFIHLFYSEEPQIVDQVKWIKGQLEAVFPQVCFVENIHDQFEVYIYGVGPVEKREGNMRILLFKNEVEDMNQFVQEFPFRSLRLFDTLCCLINIYGSVGQMSMAQSRFLHEKQSKYTATRIDRLHLYPYKYVENVERERNRPTTGFKSLGRRPQYN